MTSSSVLPHLRQLVLCGAAGWVLAGPAQAADTPPPPAASILDQVMAKARHLHEFLDVIQNKDPAIRETALELALQDSDPAVRGLALSAYLRRFEAMTPEAVLDPASSMDQADMPYLVLASVTWSQDGQSFNANSRGNGVHGQIAGGKVSIAYDYLELRPGASGQKDRGSFSCQLTLSPNAQHDALEGPLHCIGVSSVLTVRLPFGA